MALLDVSMPGLNGIETARQLMRDQPDIKICLLSMHDDDSYVIAAIQAGVHGYLLKNTDMAELAKALGAIAAGHMYFSPEIAGVLSRSVQRQDRTPDVLSGREREVLQLIAEGNNLRAIARLLSISPKTVKNHRDSIYRKTSCHSTAELVKAALRRGLTAA
jgi:DNA-binding NarL/FixJ family response regulator